MLTAMLTACGIEDADECELVQQLFFTYGRQVKALARSILHNEQDVEDAMHDTFLKIIRYRKKFTDADPTETKRLIVILTKSVCFNLYRRKKRECDLFAAEDGGPDWQDAGEIDAIEAFLARESAARLRDAINAHCPRAGDRAAEILRRPFQHRDRRAARHSRIHSRHNPLAQPEKNQRKNGGILL